PGGTALAPGSYGNLDTRSRSPAARASPRGRAGPGGSVSENALVLKGIRKAFAGHVAVAELSLEGPRNSIFGLLGPNGAGKTTTLGMVMAILGPDKGSIEILGKPADHASRDRIGYMPEERGLYPRMVLEEQLVFMAAIKGVPKQQALERLGPWLERLSLA